MKTKKFISIILIINIVLLMSTSMAWANSDMLVRNISVDSENKLITIDGIVPSVKTNNVLSIVMIDEQKELGDVEPTGSMMRFAHLGEVDVAGKRVYDYTFKYTGEKGVYNLYVTLGNLNTVLTVDTAVSTSEKSLPIAQLHNLPTEYGANTGVDVKSRFEIAKNELPEEMPVVTPVFAPHSVGKLCN